MKNTVTVHVIKKITLNINVVSRISTKHYILRTLSGTLKIIVQIDYEENCVYAVAYK
jgi:uncharacterized protein YdeI (BOF family)